MKLETRENTTLRRTFNVFFYELLDDVPVIQGQIAQGETATLKQALFEFLAKQCDTSQN